MTAFVINFNRRTGEVEVTSFAEPGGHRAAILERLRREAERDDPDLEVVSLISDSLETVKQTHGRYFDQLVEH